MAVDDRAAVRVLWIYVAAGLAGAARLLWWYWPARGMFDGTTSNIWTALAWDVAHGEFYRPLLSPSGYGGTRYMPLLFVAHGLLLRLHVDPILAGAALMQASVCAAAAALYFTLREARVRAPLAAPLACTVWSTAVYQAYCTDVRADYLAAALALTAVGLAIGHRSRAKDTWLAGAAVACVLAGLTKVTSLAVAGPLVVWLWIEGARRSAWRFAGATAALWLAAIGVVQWASHGNFLESFLATASGGMTLATIARAIPHFVQETTWEPFVGTPFLLALWCAFQAARRRRLTLVHVALAGTTLVTLVIFASPGTVANQLVDLQMMSVLVIGAALADGDASPRLIAPIYAVLAIAIAAISWPVPGLPSVMATIRRDGLLTRARVQSIHDEFLPPGTRYITNDPIFAVLYDERPVVLDEFGLELSVRSGGPAGRDFEARIRRQEYDVVIRRVDDRFPRDITAGDAGFADAAAAYWAAWPPEHAQLRAIVEPAYALRAVRQPFVILMRR